MGTGYQMERATQIFSPGIGRTINRRPRRLNRSTTVIVINSMGLKREREIQSKMILVPFYFQWHKIVILSIDIVKYNDVRRGGVFSIERLNLPSPNTQYSRTYNLCLGEGSSTFRSKRGRVRVMSMCTGPLSRSMCLERTLVAGFRANRSYARPK